MQLIENRISLLLLTYPCQEHSVIYSCNLQRWKAFDVRRRQSKWQRRCEEELKHIWVSWWGLWGQKSRGDDGWDPVVVGWKPVSKHSLSSQTHKLHGQQQKEDECARQEDESEGSWKNVEGGRPSGLFTMSWYVRHVPVWCRLSRERMVVMCSQSYIPYNSPRHVFRVYDCAYDCLFLNNMGEIWVVLIDSYMSTFFGLLSFIKHSVVSTLDLL